MQKRFSRSLPILGLFVAIFLLLLRGGGAKRKGFSQSNLLELLRNEAYASGYDEKYGDYWLAVSYHETGGWDSRLFNVANNLFGMMCVKQRRTTQDGCIQADEGLFGQYKDWERGAVDIVLYMNNARYPQNAPSNLAEFVLLMQDKGYFTASYTSYYAAVKRAAKTLRLGI